MYFIKRTVMKVLKKAFNFYRLLAHHMSKGLVNCSCTIEEYYIYGLYLLLGIDCRDVRCMQPEGDCENRYTPEGGCCEICGQGNTTYTSNTQLLMQTLLIRHLLIVTIMDVN